MEVKIRERKHSKMALHIIGGVIILLIIFGITVGTIGFVSFSNTLKDEYAVTTYHMADTATTLINGDHLDDYLEGREKEEYQRTKVYLDTYCQRISVSLIYIIQVDRSDYGRFVSVFNAVDNTVDNSSYTAWELGHERDTTNEEYAGKYRAIYEKEAPYETVYRSNPTDGQHPHITTLVPVKNSDDDVVAILCMQRPISELDAARIPYLITVGIAFIVLSVTASVLTTFFIRRQVVRPIRRVSREAERFARENTKGNELGRISKYDELARLSLSIDKMETDMVHYIDNLTTVTADRERIRAELSLASTIQETAVPDEFPAFPDRSDFDVYASMTPAKEVGGDFYNFYLVDDDHLAFVIGDVSGKGIPAALFMMVTNIVINNRTMLGGTPAEILDFVNDTICEHNKAEMFVTVWLGILEISTGKITAANAGHDDAAVCHRDGTFELFKTKHGLVIGAMPDVPYRNFEIQLEKGDKLFLYTDGVPEATDRDNKMFTIERMLDALNECRGKTPQEILESVHLRVNEFVGEAPQFDDLTMLCIELKGPGAAAKGEGS